MTIRTLLVLLAATLLSEGIARAQPSDLSTVAYPVADLVVPISTNRPGEKITTSENELMAHLRKKVAPATWEQAGGQGSMRYERKGYVLHVRQSAKVHAELKSFLDNLLREQVSIEVRLVTISEKGLEELENSGSGWSRIQWTQKNGIASALLDDVKLLRFLESVQGDRAAHIMQMPKITMFDGQEAKIGGGFEARLLPAISLDQRHVTLQAEISQTNPSYPEIKLAVVAKVPDQRTVAIVAGTMMTEVRTETASPLLSRIPYVNRLARNVGWSRDSVRVIVLLTPRIIREEESADVQPLRTRFQAEDNGKFPLIQPQGGK
jgi:hypothetical protein